MRFIDELPGPEFSSVSIKVPQVDAPYVLLKRDVLEVATTLLLRCNGKFCDPRVRYPGEFVDGERFRVLQGKLHAATGDPSCILMPLVFSSGVWPHEEFAYTYIDAGLLVRNMLLFMEHDASLFQDPGL